MRIICPTCSSHYEVDVDKIDAKGQLVRCAQCREVWLVRAPQSLAVVPPAPIVAPPAPSDAPAPQRPAGPTPRDGADDVPEPPIDFHTAKVRLRRRREAVEARRARGNGLGTITIGAVVLASFMTLYGFRTTIARHVPAASLAALGLRDDGLALREVHSALVAEGDETVLTLEGKIANLRNQPTSVPNLTVVVKGDTDVPLYTWTTTAPKAKLERGETVAFRSRLAAPPAAGRNVQVSFADASHDGVLVATP